eukprot:CAMPEP_0172929170 /NCGR_PEP_ID=MMETSP1075-20121228/218347_1 /TAXON_ID=2916 /ORGANISM="Ceratium fusus, Strain PA161109" /LENGTH=74 /DNA_ID=CAMNT_0013790459 /DNA_START=595 /DNA_END=819 /DNA_ORIENTATION=+
MSETASLVVLDGAAIEPSMVTVGGMLGMAIVGINVGGVFIGYTGGGAVTSAGPVAGCNWSCKVSSTAVAEGASG